MTREEALALIPEGYEECTYREYLPAAPTWRCYTEDNLIYARLIPEPEPKSVTFKAYRNVSSRQWLIFPIDEGLNMTIPNDTECKVTVEWTPKRGEM